ncbi:MAG: HlyD family efflux transporter periplasmic adaptor subunit [Planctomycetaceae bacterium]
MDVTFIATAILLQTLIPLSGSALSADETTDVLRVPSATLTLIREADVSAKETGALKELKIVPGARVAEGDVVGSLDDERQKLAVKTAELNHRIAVIEASDTDAVAAAEVAVREAELEKKRLEAAASISGKTAESEVAIRLAEKTVEVARLELSRAQKAKESFAASVSNAELTRLQSILDQRTLELQKATEEKGIAALRPEVDNAAVAEQTQTVERTKLLAREKQRLVEVARVNSEIAANELETAQLMLQRRQLIAPFAGSIVAVHRQPGEWVEPGTAVFRLIALDRLRAECMVEAKHLNRLKVGMPVRIIRKDSQSEPVSGTLAWVGDEIEPVNQQVRIWVEFDNSKVRMRPGMVVSLEIPLE